MDIIPNKALSFPPPLPFPFACFENRKQKLAVRQGLWGFRKKKGFDFGDLA